MTPEYQMTPEERAYNQFFEEHWESLSEAARTICREAWIAAYEECMVRNYIPSEEDYDEAMKKMGLAADELTDHEHKLLAKLWRAALAAAASIDSEDYETVVAFRAFLGDLHHCYRMFSGIVEDILEEKESKREKELARRAPIDHKDPPF